MVLETVFRGITYPFLNLGRNAVFYFKGCWNGMPFLFPLILGYTSLNKINRTAHFSHSFGLLQRRSNFCSSSQPHQHIRLASYIPTRIFRYPFVLYALYQKNESFQRNWIPLRMQCNSCFYNILNFIPKLSVYDLNLWKSWPYSLCTFCNLVLLSVLWNKWDN